MKQLKNYLMPVVLVFALVIITSCSNQTGSSGDMMSDAKQQAELDCKVKKLQSEAREDSENAELQTQLETLRAEASVLKKELREKYVGETEKREFKEAVSEAYNSLEECSGVDMGGKPARGKGGQGEKKERPEKGPKIEADPELVAKYKDAAEALSQMRCEMQLKRLELKKDTSDTEMKGKVELMKVEYDKAKEEQYKIIGEDENEQNAFKTAMKQARETLDVCKEVTKLRPKKKGRKDRGNRGNRGDRGEGKNRKKKNAPAEEE